MVIDGNSFLKRANIFIGYLNANKYPNSTTLKEACRCSKNTAQRTIYRLRDEYFVPLEYDEERKGYYLKDKNYVFDAALPPGKDELVALLLARNITATLNDSGVNEKLDSLWHQFIAKNKSIHTELKPISEVFSVNYTAISEIADAGVLNYVFAAATGESVCIKYKSPWLHNEPKSYEGKISHVRYADGALYLLVLDKSGQYRTLNAAFIKEFKILNYTVDIKRLPANERSGNENWLEGFGIWANEELREVEIWIKPPAAEYYSAQVWHEDQEDVFDGEILIRKFQAIISPELVRRILSIGEHISTVKPSELAHEVARQLKIMSQNVAS